MATARPNSLKSQHHVILGLLLATAAVAWIVLARQQGGHASMDMPMPTPTVGWEVSLFLVNWVVMMVAMMFPAVAPMALAFHVLTIATRPRENAFASTWVFVSAYLLVWAIAGLAAYAAMLAARYAATRVPLSTTVTTQLGAAVIFTAGVYQLTPLKEFCLSRCRDPNRFVVGSWLEGTEGAVRLGLLHGAYCMGCCWLLFVVLFQFGMNLVSMIVVTLIVLAERRTVSWSQPVSHVVGLALVFYGAFLVVTGQLLPVPNPSDMTTPAEMQMDMLLR